VLLADATDLLRLLGDPNRVRLLALLAEQPLTVAELTEVTRLSQSRVSAHLARLKEAGFLQDRKDGRATFYRLRSSLPPAARRCWELVKESTRDPLLREDDARLRGVLRARSGGARWADSVAGRMERHYSPGRTWEAALRGLLGLMRLGSVLDVASGDCSLAELLAPRAASITCLDRSTTVLEAGRRRLARHGHVAFRRGDMHALPFADASFDHVLMMACLTHAEDPARALAEAARVLRPGGDLVAVTLRRHEHLDHAARYDHLHPGFEADALRALLADAGLQPHACSVTSRERRKPHFEILTAHATR